MVFAVIISGVIEESEKQGEVRLNVERVGREGIVRGRLEDGHGVGKITV